NASSSSLDSNTPSASLADVINVRGIKIAGWTIETHRGSIADSKTIDDLSDSWGIPLPEMPFDKNKLVIRYDGEQQSWQYSFDGMSALQSVEGVSESSALKGLELNQSASHHKGTTRFGEKPKKKRVQVSYANEWGKKRDQQQKSRSDSDHIPGPESRSNFGPEIAMAAATNSIATARDFDWTYTSTWPGKEDVSKENEQSLFAAGQDPNRDRIPIERLGPPPTPGAKAEPILFFDDLILFEDELGDNGTSLLNVKIRVMPTGLLVLQRFFLRVDNVVFRVFDTRMYVGFYDDQTINSHTPSLQQGQNISRATEQLTNLSLDSQSQSTPALASPFRVIRECSGLEEPYTAIRSRLPPYKPNDLSPLTDVGWVAQQLTKMEEDRQRKLFTAHQSRAGTHPGTTVSLEQSDPTQPAVLPSDTVPGQESNRILGEVEDDAENRWEGQGYRVDVALL
ncbi:TIP41-domain-containing protein, partial [Meira miltonrushii]